jgi:transcriptional regulator
MTERKQILHVGPAFRITDPAQALELLASYNLGTLISAGGDGWPRASVSPLIIRNDEQGKPRLYAHLDRRNPQVEHLREQRPLLYVAYGPRAYVSPGWFPRRPAAPTHLHLTVHVRARAELLDEERTSWLLLESVASFERRLPRPWRYDSGERFLNGSAKGVAGFELVVDEIEAACKMSQDRSPEERMLIAAELEQSPRSDDRTIAALLRALDTSPDNHNRPIGSQTADAAAETRQ